MIDPHSLQDSIVWRPSPAMRAQANLSRFMQRHGFSTCDELLQRSVQDIEWFWDASMKDLGVEWYEPYREVLDASRGMPWCRWFGGGRVNLVHNCLDRHLPALASKTALIWEREDGESRQLTYGELDAKVSQIAGALRRAGVAPGDAVGLYMPMLPETVIALLACWKIGAAVVPVFAGFGAEALAVRLHDAGAKLVFTAESSVRRGHEIALKPIVDEALRRVPSVKTVVVLRRSRGELPWMAGRDVEWKSFLEGGNGAARTESLDSEGRCLIIYTSGTTGRPKGTVHTHGGVIAQIPRELAYFMDVKQEDRFFWLTDIGWMMGAWEIVGVLFLGATLVLYEGAPNWPEPDRLWRLVDRQRLTHLGASPTAIRMLLRAGDEWVERHDLSSLRILASTGEPWDPESYLWYFTRVGRERCPIINISGGTELMGCLLACSPLMPLKPCSFQGPGLGMDVDVLDERGESVRGAVGYLALKKPAPSMTRGFLNDDARYLETYFSRWPGVWYHGDWARVDSDGFWFIQGRADDTIKVAGKRTGPAEIEAALLAHDMVSEAAAIGVPDEIKGEAVVCFVVLKPGSPEAESLLSDLSDQVVRCLGKTLRPERIHVVVSLPKTCSAKIVRQAIRKCYLGEPAGDITSVENPEALLKLPQRHST